MSKTVTITRPRPRNVTELVDLWPGNPIKSFAADVGTKPFNVYSMRTRNVIDSKYWKRIVASAKKHGISGIDLELLAEIDERRLRAA